MSLFLPRLDNSFLCEVYLLVLSSLVDCCVNFFQRKTGYLSGGENIRILSLGNHVGHEVIVLVLYEGRFFDENFAICQNFAIFDN